MLRNVSLNEPTFWGHYLRILIGFKLIGIYGVLLKLVWVVSGT